MVRLALVALVLVLVGCTQPPPELPWLHGSEIAALSTSVIPGRNPDDSASPCGDRAFDHIELVADLTAEPGVETLRASAAQGVQVRATGGALVAQAVPEPCEAVDRIRALAVASGLVLVVDARRATTQVTVLRPTARRHLERVYAGVVERGRGDDVRIGTLALLGDRLVHTDPDGGTTVVRLLGTPGAR